MSPANLTAHVHISLFTLLITSVCLLIAFYLFNYSLFLLSVSVATAWANGLGRDTLWGFTASRSRQDASRQWRQAPWSYRRGHPRRPPLDLSQLSCVRSADSSGCDVSVNQCLLMGTHIYICMLVWKQCWIHQLMSLQHTQHPQFLQHRQPLGTSSSSAEEGSRSSKNRKMIGRMIAFWDRIPDHEQVQKDLKPLADAMIGNLSRSMQVRVASDPQLTHPGPSTQSEARRACHPSESGHSRMVETTESH